MLLNKSNFDKNEKLYANCFICLCLYLKNLFKKNIFLDGA